MGLFGFIYSILIDFIRFIWVYLGLLGFIWVYLNLFGFIWVYLDLGEWLGDVGRALRRLEDWGLGSNHKATCNTFEPELDPFLQFALVGGVPREQKMLKGHLPRVIYHQVY